MRKSDSKLVAGHCDAWCLVAIALARAGRLLFLSVAVEAKLADHRLIV